MVWPTTNAANHDDRMCCVLVYGGSLCLASYSARPGHFLHLCLSTSLYVASPPRCGGHHSPIQANPMLCPPFSPDVTFLSSQYWSRLSSCLRSADASTLFAPILGVTSLFSTVSECCSCRCQTCRTLSNRPYPLPGGWCLCRISGRILWRACISARWHGYAAVIVAPLPCRVRVPRVHTHTSAPPAHQ